MPSGFGGLCILLFIVQVLKAQEILNATDVATDVAQQQSNTTDIQQQFNTTDVIQQPSFNTTNVTLQPSVNATDVIQQPSINATDVPQQNPVATTIGATQYTIVLGGTLSSFDQSAVIDEGFYLFWNLNNTHIQLALQYASGGGWLGFGFASCGGCQSPMIGSNAVIGWNNNIGDYFLLGKSPSQVVASQIQNLTDKLYDYNSKTGMVTVVFTRPLIIPGAVSIKPSLPTNCIWAYGDAPINNQLTQHIYSNYGNVSFGIWGGGLPLQLFPSTIVAVTPKGSHSILFLGQVISFSYVAVIDYVSQQPMTLYWTIVGDTIQLAISYRSNGGWLAFGFADCDNCTFPSQAVAGWSGPSGSGSGDFTLIANLPNLMTVTNQQQVVQQFVDYNPFGMITVMFQRPLQIVGGLSITPDTLNHCIWATGPAPTDPTILPTAVYWNNANLNLTSGGTAYITPIFIPNITFNDTNVSTPAPSNSPYQPNNTVPIPWGNEFNYSITPAPTLVTPTTPPQKHTIMFKGDSLTFERWAEIDKGFNLYWTLTNNSVFIALIRQTGGGWLGFGFTPCDVCHEPMLYSHAVVGWWKGQGYTGDYFLGGKDPAQVIITEAQKLMNQDLYFNPNSGEVTLLFQRPLIVPGLPIIYASGQTHCIWAYGSAPQGDHISVHLYANDGMIDFSTGEVRIGRTTLYKRIHGALMGLSWGFFIPLGMLGARMKHWRPPLWFHLHRIFQIIGVVMTTCAFVLAMTKLDHGAYPTHRGIGWAVTMIALLQPFIAIIRPPPPKDGHTISTQRWYWYLTHAWVGRIGCLLAFTNIIIGFGLINIALPYRILMALWMGLLIGIYLIHVACFGAINRSSVIIIKGEPIEIGSSPTRGNSQLDLVFRASPESMSASAAATYLTPNKGDSQNEITLSSQGQIHPALYSASASRSLALSGLVLEAGTEFSIAENLEGQPRDPLEDINMTKIHMTPSQLASPISHFRSSHIRSMSHSLSQQHQPPPPPPPRPPQHPHRDIND